MLCEIRGCEHRESVGVSWDSEGSGTRLEWFRVCSVHAEGLRMAHRLDGWRTVKLAPTVEELLAEVTE